MLVKNIEIPKAQIVDFWQRWKHTEFALFGSVLRDDFPPDSDIDVLAIFEPDFHWTLLKLMQMEEEIEAIFERKVDFVSKRAIEQSLNYLRRKAILNSAQVIYTRFLQ
jgi:predicted nucleotidyltransferase